MLQDGEVLYDHVDLLAKDEYGLQSNVTIIEFEVPQSPEVSLSVTTENHQSPYVCRFSSSQSNNSFINQVVSNPVNEP